MAPLTVNLADAAASLGIGKSKLYQLINAGEVETATIGKRSMVVVASLHRLVERSRANG